MNKLQELVGILRRIVEQLDIITVEKDAVERLAIKKGATYPEVEQAKQEALDDPEIRQETRETYAAMWKALEDAGTAAFAEEMFRDLPRSGPVH